MAISHGEEVWLIVDTSLKAFLKVCDGLSEEEFLNVVVANALTLRRGFGRL